LRRPQWRLVLVGLLGHGSQASHQTRLAIVFWRLRVIPDDMTRDVVLLGNRKRVVDHPVQHQTCREKREEHAKDQRQKLKDFLLNGINGCRIEFLLEIHGRCHDHRQDKKRIANR